MPDQGNDTNGKNDATHVAEQRTEPSSQQLRCKAGERNEDGDGTNDCTCCGSDGVEAVMGVDGDNEKNGRSNARENDNRCCSGRANYESVPAEVFSNHEEEAIDNEHAENIRNNVLVFNKNIGKFDEFASARKKGGGIMVLVKDKRS